MGKKNKKDKKGQGKEKTLQKTEKKANKRLKKELAVKGEEDVERMIAVFEEESGKKKKVVEEKCGPPSPRYSMTLTPHPDKDELIMFGGEYFTGNQMHMYDELLFYNIKKNEWLKVTAPKAPPPRSAHQAVALKQGGGQLWVFGGEFASPSQSQFYHYRDLWVFHIRDKKWEKINAPGGPSSRSGHRMVQCKKQIIVFGGFHDNTREYKYFNDVYAFNLDTYTWVQLDPSGHPPSPRSGCVMAALQDQGRVVIYGGYSKEKLKKDNDEGKTHSDMYMLLPEGKLKEDTHPAKWKWTCVKQSGARPTTRSGLSLAVVPGNRALCFGGVFDEEENDEKIRGKFYNNMYSLELEKGKWFEVELRGKKSVDKKKRRRKKEGGNDDANMDDDDDNDDEMEDMEVCEEDIQRLSLRNETDSARMSSQNGAMPGTSSSGEAIQEVEMDANPEEESVFKVTVGPQSAYSAGGASANAGSGHAAVFMPSPRMNALMSVVNGMLYLYGGMYEHGDRQYTFSDFYSLDVHKLDEWNTIIENNFKDQVWEELDSSSDEDEGAAGGDSDSDSDDEEMDIDFSDAPEKPASEPTAEYFERTKDYWVAKAKEYCDSEDLTLSSRKLEKLAAEMCQEAFDD